MFKFPTDTVVLNDELPSDVVLISFGITLFLFATNDYSISSLLQQLPLLKK